MNNFTETYYYAAHSNFTVTCIREINVGSDGRIHCWENRVTSWQAVIYPPTSRIFNRESDALAYVIDQAETRVRDLTLQKMSADDRECESTEARVFESIDEANDCLPECPKPHEGSGGAHWWYLDVEVSQREEDDYVCCVCKTCARKMKLSADAEEYPAA